MDAKVEENVTNATMTKPDTNDTPKRNKKINVSLFTLLIKLRFTHNIVGYAHLIIKDFCIKIEIGIRKQHVNICI